MSSSKQLSIPTFKTEACYNISFQSDVNVSETDHVSVETSTIQLSCNVSGRNNICILVEAKADDCVITEPVTLISLPTEVLELILKNLSIENMANFRCVLLQNKFLGIKVQMPRQESARRKHPMARESDIILHMRPSLLQMTFGKHIERKQCCFFSGLNLDEVYKIIKYVEMSPNLSRTYKVTDELFDLSTMAMEYFKEHIEPNLPEITYFATDFLDYLPSVSSSPKPLAFFFGDSLSSKCTGIINPELLVESAAAPPMNPAVDRSIRRLRELFKNYVLRDNNQIQSIKLAQQLLNKKKNSTQKEIHQLKRQLKEYKKKLSHVSLKLDCALNELNKCNTELEFFRSKPSCSQCHKNDNWKMFQVHILKDDVSEESATKSFKRDHEVEDRKCKRFHICTPECLPTKARNGDIKCRRLHIHTDDCFSKKAKNEDRKCKRLHIHTYDCSLKKVASHNPKNYVTKRKKISNSCQQSLVTSSSKKDKVKRLKKSIRACNDIPVTRVTRSSRKLSSYDSFWSFSDSLPKHPPYLMITPLKHSLALDNSMGSSSFIDSTTSNSSVYSNVPAEDCLQVEQNAALQELQVLPNSVHNILCSLEDSHSAEHNILCHSEASPKPTALHELNASSETVNLQELQSPFKPEVLLESPEPKVLCELENPPKSKVLLEFEELKELPKPVHNTVCPLETSPEPNNLLCLLEESPEAEHNISYLFEASPEVIKEPLITIKKRVCTAEPLKHEFMGKYNYACDCERIGSYILKDVKLITKEDKLVDNKKFFFFEDVPVDYNDSITKKKRRVNDDDSVIEKESKQCSSVNKIIKRSESTKKRVRTTPRLKCKLMKNNKKKNVKMSRCSIRSGDNLDSVHKKKSRAYGVRDTNFSGSDYYNLYRNNILYIRPPTFLKHLKF